MRGGDCWIVHRELGSVGIFRLFWFVWNLTVTGNFARDTGDEHRVI